MDYNIQKGIKLVSMVIITSISWPLNKFLQILNSGSFSSDSQLPKHWDKHIFSYLKRVICDPTVTFLHSYWNSYNAFCIKQYEFLYCCICPPKFKTEIGDFFFWLSSFSVSILHLFSAWKHVTLSTGRGPRTCINPKPAVPKTEMCKQADNTFHIQRWVTVKLGGPLLGSALFTSSSLGTWTTKESSQ